MKKWMKASFLLMAVLMISSVAFYSCDDDDKLPSSVEDAFWAKYPKATDVSWEKTKHHYVFDFYNNQKPAEAFFNHSSQWEYTETEIPYSSLPTAVQNSFKESQWAGWSYDAGDILEIDQPKGLLYLLDLESGNEEIELLYTPQGELKKSAVDIFYPYWTW
ncbi:MAG: PepSY-like domain-containing protein [Bacteroidales bacterium]